MKKNEKNMQNVEEMPSKGKIIFAWIMLIVLSGCLGGVIYLKNFSAPVIEEEPEVVNKVSPVITAVLTDIVDKFNASSMLEGYRQDGLNLSASLKDSTITIVYTATDVNGSVDYVYNISGNLSTVVPNTNNDINDKIFKVLVVACRNRLNITEDILIELDNFVANGIELNGLKKESVNSNITYFVDVRYPAVSTETGSQTSSVVTSSVQSENFTNDSDLNSTINDSSNVESDQTIVTDNAVNE